jgi:hypothetical protein
MIKCHIEKNRIIYAVVYGSLGDFMTELGGLIENIYKELHSQSPDSAKHFQAAMRALMADDSPVWRIEEDGGDTQ